MSESASSTDADAATAATASSAAQTSIPNPNSPPRFPPGRRPRNRVLSSVDGRVCVDSTHVDPPSSADGLTAAAPPTHLLVSTHECAYDMHINKVSKHIRTYIAVVYLLLPRLCLRYSHSLFLSRSLSRSRSLPFSLSVSACVCMCGSWRWVWRVWTCSLASWRGRRCPTEATSPSPRTDTPPPPPPLLEDNHSHSHRNQGQSHRSSRSSSSSQSSDRGGICCHTCSSYRRAATRTMTVVTATMIAMATAMAVAPVSTEDLCSPMSCPS